MNGIGRQDKILFVAIKMTEEERRRDKYNAQTRANAAVFVRPGKSQPRAGRAFFQIGIDIF